MTDLSVPKDPGMRRAGQPLESQRLIFDLDLSELEAILESWGEPAYRARQIWPGLYKSLWSSPQAFTNLPKPLRLKLEANFSFSHLQAGTVLDSADGQTRKTLFHLPDQRLIEAVLMRYGDEASPEVGGETTRQRRTLCISTQAGCAMGCVFCATGQMGFFRHLSSGEIVEQVLYYARQLQAEGERVTNVVVMGMGEPFHNYENTLQAVERLNSSEGFDFGARRFTISTVGLVPAIRRFTAEKRQVNLAISLHAADDRLRASLLPVDRRYPIAELMLACQEYVEHTHRRLTFEWALIRGVNDTHEQAEKLAALLQVFRKDGAARCHVNIIPLNPTRRYPGEATTRQQAQAFQQILEGRGIPCTIRLRRGIDIQAGCGQLAGGDQ